MPGATADSLAFSLATNAAVQPLSRAAITWASAPRTGRKRPSRASSAMKTRPSIASASIAPDAARMPIAIGRSRPAPLFFRFAGARLIVTRRSGNFSPIEEMAARTRAALSRTAASGNPTMSTRGSCELMRTSTSTQTPSMPVSAVPQTRDTMSTSRDREMGFRGEGGRAHRSVALPPTSEESREDGTPINDVVGTSRKCQI